MAELFGTRCQNCGTMMLRGADDLDVCADCMTTADAVPQ